LNDMLTKYMADNVGKGYDETKLSMDRDFFMSAKEAQGFGIIDKVIIKWSEVE
jgi:ATP-dependent protease ClpP protease subunit